MKYSQLVDDQKADFERRLLAEVPGDGSGIGNSTLQDRLGAWDEDIFWETRNQLIAKGLLAKGRGRGGSVHRVTPVAATAGAATAPVGTPDTIDEEARAEGALYEPAANVIRNSWARDYAFDNYSVEVIARQGRRETGGRWTRPDIVLVALTTYAWLPGKYLDVVTFEVKPEKYIDITAVYEAVSHSRAATRSYVLLQVPAARADDFESVIEEICVEARRHGIGVIVATEMANYETWDERVEAERREPDPARMNSFISTQVSEATKEKVQKWNR